VKKASHKTKGKTKVVEPLASCSTSSSHPSKENGPSGSTKEVENKDGVTHKKYHKKKK
jgi:hypothetical protein